MITTCTTEHTILGYYIEARSNSDGQLSCMWKGLWEDTNHILYTKLPNTNWRILTRQDFPYIKLLEDMMNARGVR